MEYIIRSKAEKYVRENSKTNMKILEEIINSNNMNKEHKNIDCLQKILYNKKIGVECTFYIDSSYIIATKDRRMI